MKDFFKRVPRPGSHEQEATPSDQLDTGHAPKFAWKPLAGSGAADAGKPDKSALATSKADNIPDNLWIKCPNCKELIYTKEFENNKKVCTKCGYHTRLRAYERVESILDEGTFEEINRDLISADPLGFASLTESPYVIKAVETRKKTGVNEAIVTGFGRLEDMPLAVAVCDFAFQGGSMGSVFGEKLVRLIEAAIERHLPVLTVSASGGARMHEGLFSLMQMAKTTAALGRLGQHRLPHFSLLTDPTTGGVVASYASVADVMMAEPGALIGFAGPRVIEQTTKQKLPADFQTAEFLLEHGMIDQVVPRREFRTVLANLLKIYAVVPQPVGEVVYAR